MIKKTAVYEKAAVLMKFSMKIYAVGKILRDMKTGFLCRDIFFCVSDKTD